MVLDELLQAALATAKQAGDEILKIYGEKEIAFQSKADNSPLTEADLAAHRTIQKELGVLPEVFPLLSEESEEIPFEERRKWRTFWLIDPLDGTKEFLQRNGEFTVNIALIHDHLPILGIVHAPALGVTYFAAQGLGAFCEQEGRCFPISVHKPANPRIRVVASRSHPSPQVDQYLKNLPFPSEKISIGSSLKFCLVAEGRADLYPRFGPTNEWDTAAAHAVLLEAGGQVVDLEGKPLRYNTRPSLKNPLFLAYGDDSIPWLNFLP